jgi:phosphate transport system protein
MTNHTVKAFDAELETIRAVIGEMGEKARQMLADAASALMNLDVGLANNVAAADAHINELQRNVVDKAIYTIAKRQPVADDLGEASAQAAEPGRVHAVAGTGTARRRTGRPGS